MEPILHPFLSRPEVMREAGARMSSWTAPFIPDPRRHQGILVQLSIQPHHSTTRLHPADARPSHAPHIKPPSSLYLEYQLDSDLPTCWLRASHLLQEAFLHVPSCHVILGRPILAPGSTVGLVFPTRGEQDEVVECSDPWTFVHTEVHLSGETIEDQVRWAQKVRPGPLLQGQPLL